MIKKFKEFNENKNIRDILTPEELDDQFLRLKEVFGCIVKGSFYNETLKSIEKKFSISSKQKIFFEHFLAGYDVKNGFISIIIKYNTDNKDEVEKELETIKRRFELIYQVKVQYHVDVFGNGFAWRISAGLKKIFKDKEIYANFLIKMT